MEFHEDLVKEGVHCPVIFISGHADVPMSVKAMKAGAIEFLTKPVRHQDLLDAIELAVERNRAQRDGARQARELRIRFDALTPREQAVMRLVVLGHPNKQIAAEIGITEGTVKLHRGQVMRKMKVQSLAELVRIADRLLSTPLEPPRL
jgi:FixJ family two-component response regulator